MTGKQLKIIIKSKGFQMVFIAKKIKVHKTALSLALNDKRTGRASKEILEKVQKFLKKH